MDLSRPIEGLIPGAQGQLLAALAGAGRELSTKTAADIAGVSAPHASRVLAHLVQLGVVERRDVPPTALYSLVEDSFVGRILLEVCNLRNRVFHEMIAAAADIRPGVVEIAAFGSVARGDSDVESDIDVLLVAPTGEVDSDEWNDSVAGWTDRISTFSGCPVNVLALDETEWAEHARRRSNLWLEIMRDGVFLLTHSSAAFEIAT